MHSDKNLKSKFFRTKFMYIYILIYTVHKYIYYFYYSTLCRIFFLLIIFRICVWVSVIFFLLNFFFYSSFSFKVIITIILILIASIFQNFVSSFPSTKTKKVYCNTKILSTEKLFRISIPYEIIAQWWLLFPIILTAA